MFEFPFVANGNQPHPDGNSTDDLLVKPMDAS
jgi:hypothetical protein